MKFKKFKLLLLLLSFTFFITGCGNEGNNNTGWIVDSTAPSDSIKAVEGTLFLDNSTYDIYQMSNSSWVRIGNIKGENGIDGTNGITPSISISSDGYWVINNQKTNILAKGQNGKDATGGLPGKDGINGTNGKDGIDGTNGKDGVDGKDGITPTIEIGNNGNWIINGVDSGVKAVGQDGKSVYIGYDGYIWCGSERTNLKNNELSANKYIIDSTVGIEDEMSKYFEHGYLNLSTNIVSLMNGYNESTNKTSYSGKNIEELTVYAESDGTLNIGTAKVSDIINSRLNGTSLSVKTSKYNVKKGKNILSLNLLVGREETIVLGGNNSTGLFYLNGINSEDQNGIYTLINSNSNNNIFEASSKIYVSSKMSLYDWSQSTITFVGDSITYGASTTKTYWQYLSEDLNLMSAVNMGVNGSTYSLNSDYGTARTPLAMRYQNITDTDLIMIFMGTNDYGHETPLGKITDTTDVSFYGAVNMVVSELLERHPNSTLVLATPIHRYGAGTSGILGTNYTYDNIPNGRGHTLEDYVNAIKEIAAKNSLPVIDLYNLYTVDPTNATDRTKYIPDGLHPNAEGHKILANIIKEELINIPLNRLVESKLVYGNNFSVDTSFHDNITRVTNNENIYLTAGTMLYLKNPKKYAWAVYKQNDKNVVAIPDVALYNGWYSYNILIKESGWYGITLKKLSEESFDLNGKDSNYLSSYISFTSNQMQISNRYFIANINDTNRVSLTTNVYLSAGTTIKIKDPSTYLLGVIAQNDYSISFAERALQSWAPTNFVTTSDGWYGIALKRVDEANINFNGVDPKTLSEYIEFIK